MPIYLSIYLYLFYLDVVLFSPGSYSNLFKTWKIFSSLISENRVTKEIKRWTAVIQDVFSDSAESRHFCDFWLYLRSEDCKRQFKLDLDLRKLEIRSMKLFQFKMEHKQTLYALDTFSRTPFLGTSPKNRTSNSVFSRLAHMLSSYVWTSGGITYHELLIFSYRTESTTA